MKATRWRDSLPDVSDDRPHDLHALDNLATALWRVGGAGMLDSAGIASAHIRAWRKSLGTPDARRPDYPVDMTDEELLWWAAESVARAAGRGLHPEWTLRDAEAALRTIWRRHQEREKAT